MFRWGTVIILTGLLGLLFPIRAVYLVFYLVALTTLAAGRFYLRSASGISVEVKPGARSIFCGEQTRLEISVGNPSWIPIPWVSLQEFVPLALGYGSRLGRVLCLGPKKTRTWMIPLWSTRRGVYPLGPLSVEIGDPLGAGSRAFEVDPVEITVYPRVVCLERPPLPFKLPYSSIPARMALFEDRAKPKGVRDYLVQDPTNRIHWKLTAKAGKLQVKEFEPTTALETMVFLNLDRADYELHFLEESCELAVEAAASIIVALTRLGQPVGLGLNGEFTALGMPVRRPHQVAELLRFLAVCSVGDSKPFLELINENTGHLPWGTTLVIITPADTEGLVKTAIALKGSGFSPVILVAGRKVFCPELVAGARRLGVGCVNIRNEEELRLWGNALMS